MAAPTSLRPKLRRQVSTLSELAPYGLRLQQNSTYTACWASTRSSHVSIPDHGTNFLYTTVPGFAGATGLACKVHGIIAHVKQCHNVLCQGL